MKNLEEALNTERVVYSEETIQARIKELGSQITKDFYGKELVVGSGGHEGLALLVIDYLGIDLLVAPEDNQSWPFSSSIDMLADAVMDPSSSFNFIQCHICVLLII